MEESETAGPGYQSCEFAVNRSPYCIWNRDLETFNRSAIRGIDPNYYLYLLEIHTPSLEKSEIRQYAAIALRVAYLQGLESFFALLFASLQAPRCISGWLNKYRVGDLRNLVTDIDNERAILSRFPATSPTWESISDLVHVGLDADDTDNDSIATIFGKLWAHLAEEFLKTPNINEYNSIKHGFRLNLGGYGLSIDKQLIGESKFGSSFIKTEKIDEISHHLEAIFAWVNWEPEYLRAALHGMAFSINNLRTFLKRYNGIATDNDCYKVYTDLTMYEAMLEQYLRPTVMNMSMNPSLGVENIKPISKKEILDSYVSPGPAPTDHDQ